MSTHVSSKLRRVSNTLVQAALGVGSVNFWSFTVAWTRGGGYVTECAHASSFRSSLTVFDEVVEGILSDLAINVELCHTIPCLRLRGTVGIRLHVC